jgi:hypothetical protein
MSERVFAILPESDDFIFEDAEYFDDESKAYDSAFDWSVELSGVPVIVYDATNSKIIPLTKVFA